MPDGKEILVSGIANAGERNQIYRAAYPSGDFQRVPTTSTIMKASASPRTAPRWLPCKAGRM